MDRLIDRLNPARIFWLFVLAHAALWIIIPALTAPNVLSDVIEGYAWGHEWPLGTAKHPPLAAWILETLAILTGRAKWAHFFAGQASIAVAFWAVWQTGRRIAGESGALIGALLLIGIAYYNVITPEFNPNVLQLPLWALVARSFYRAVKDDRLADWLLLGLWAAAGLYAKYSSFLILAALGILMLAHPDCRKRLRSPGPWLALLTAFALSFPHLIWLFQHNFQPLIYAGARVELSDHGALAGPAMFIFWQIVTCLPAILIFALAFGRKIAPRRDFASFDGMFLSFVTFGPLILTSIMAMMGSTQIRNMWATPFWNFLGLWAVFCFRPVFSPSALRRFYWLTAFVLLAGLIGTAAKNIYQPYITHKAGRIYFPGPALAAQITGEWRKRYHTPLRYIVGDVWVAGNVGYYSPDRPHVFIVGDYHMDPWISPGDIHEYGRIVKKYGGIMVWCRGDCTAEFPMRILPCLGDFPQAEEQSPLTIPQQTGANVPPVKVGWALLPPEDADKP